MELEYFNEAAEEFARRIWHLKEMMKIENLMLYGSVARKKPNPRDLDLLIIHNNPKLEKFQEILKAKRFSSDFEEFLELEKILKIDLKKLFNGSKILDLVSKGLFQTSYVQGIYFSDLEYRKKWDIQNQDSGFLGRIFQYGKLWNPKTNHFDIPAKFIYNLK